MKKKLFMTLLAVFIFIPFTKANALELTQDLINDACTNTPDTDIGGLVCHIEDEDREITLLSGTHSLNEDIEAYTFQFFDADGNTILNLNNHTLTGEIIVSYNNTLTLNGPGTVTGNVAVEQGNITINGGNYNNGIIMLLGKLIITDAIVNSGTKTTAIAIADLSEAIISGGTFNGNIAGIGVSNEGGLGNIKSLTISGGTFNGNMAGLLIYSYDIDSIKISGGTFNGNMYGIAAVNNEETKANTILTDILDDGYTYSPDMTFNTEYDSEEEIWISYTNQKELSVVQKDNNTSTEDDTITEDNTDDSKDDVTEEKDTENTEDDVDTNTLNNTINNPKTEDNIFLYITLLVLSIIGLTSVSFKKLFTNKKI